MRLALVLALLASPLSAADFPLADGAEIVKAISGNTVKGSMEVGGPYTEFYDRDGTIRGKDYTGRWRVEGDTMCFAYGADPETCWNVSLSDAQVTWVSNGTAEGAGTILAGNPNRY